MAPRLLALPAACLLLLAAAPAPGALSAAPDCDGPAGHVWFLAISYDSARRADFIVDVENFEFFLQQLRLVYCIPASQARILAMDNNFTHRGVIYPEATEGNLKLSLEEFGAAASQHEDSLFIFMLSSHGTFYVSASCNGETRAPGSLASLKTSAGQDGSFRDCELGNALTTKFDPDVRQVIVVDCSFCGGFSDSLTAVSGTLADDSQPTGSGVVAPNRVVITGCAITTECFGSSQGGISYTHMRFTLENGIEYCDGWTAPGFPAVQGFDVPVNNALVHAPDGACTVSEWFFGSVASAYASGDVIGIQQQFRIKYGLADLAGDIRIL